jgi:hypothetical protein
MLFSAEFCRNADRLKSAKGCRLGRGLWRLSAVTEKNASLASDVGANPFLVKLQNMVLRSPTASTFPEFCF